MFRHYDEDKDMEVEVDDDFVGYILNTYVSDKTIEEVGKDKVEAVISDLIEHGIIDTDEIEKEDGYDEYMREFHCNEISDLEDEQAENRKAWEETLASLPR